MSALEHQRPAPEPERAPRWPYARLMRPANVVTALADVAAGAAIAGVFWTPAWPALALAGAALYAGGVTLNDVCDAEIDAVERPERPIPSGAADLASARALAAGLLGAGTLVAWLVGPWSGAVATAIALTAVAYDTRLKHRPLAGPVAMGACRALNLLLGMSAAPALLGSAWPLALLPLAYVAGITLVSRGEVSGGDGTAGAVALALMGAVVASLLALGPALGAGLVAWPFVALLACRVLPPIFHAARRAHPVAVRRAVRSGVLSLVIVNAALAASFAGPVAGLVVLTLWPVSAWLARTFSVT